MKTLLIIFFLFNSLYTQNKWEMVEGSDTISGQRIEQIECVDSNNCFLLIRGQIEGNKIYKSTNKGLNWRLISLHKFGGGEYVAGAYFKNNNDFYLTSSNRFLAISKNGGNDFNTYEIETQYSYLDKIIMNDNNGIIVSFPNTIFTNNDWQSNYLVELGFIFDFDFLDTNNVLILTNTEVDKVNHVFMEIYNYNFTSQSSIHISDLGGYIYPFKMERAKNNIFVVGAEMNSMTGGSANNVIYKSSDFGKTWRRVHDVYYHQFLIPYLNNIDESKVFGILDVSFKNDSVGIAVGRSGMIMHTFDAGETWYYEFDETIPDELKTAPTMRCEYIGNTPVISGFQNYIFRLKENNLAPRPEDTITIDGYVFEKGEPKEGIAISLENRFAMTNSNGYFRFIQVKEGGYSLIPINNKKANYTPYDFEPKIVTLNLKKDTTINFELIDKRRYYNISGRVLKDGVGFEGIAVEAKLDDKKIVPVLDTVYTDKSGVFTFENMENREYDIRPLSDEYSFKPTSHHITLDTNFAIYTPFEVFTTSVSDEHLNFEFKNNILYSKEIGGHTYRLIDLQGRVIKSSNLMPTLDFNYLDNGTYILQITKNNSEVFSQKFQVVR